MSRRDRAPHLRRAVAVVLVVLATVTAFLSVYAVWARQQVLDGPTWADTSTRVIENGQVRDSVARFLADNLVADASVRTALAPLLTPAQRAASTDQTEALRSALETAARTGLATAPVKRAWRNANLDAQRELVGILDGGGDAASSRHGKVTIDLRRTVRLIADTVGLQSLDLDGVPSRRTTLVVMRSEDLGTAKDVLRSIRGLSIVLPLLTLLCWGLALLVAPRHRRATLVQITVGLFLVSAAVLLTRSLARDAVLDSLPIPAADRGAAEQAWSIGTSLLRTAAIVVLVLAVLTIPLAVLAGPGPPTAPQGHERDAEAELLDQLAGLVDLRNRGAISEGEYAIRRRQLLAGRR